MEAKELRRKGDGVRISVKPNALAYTKSRKH